MPDGSIRRLKEHADENIIAALREENRSLRARLESERAVWLADSTGLVEPTRVVRSEAMAEEYRRSGHWRVEGPFVLVAPPRKEQSR